MSYIFFLNLIKQNKSYLDFFYKKIKVRFFALNDIHIYCLGWYHLYKKKIKLIYTYIILNIFFFIVILFV